MKPILTTISPNAGADDVRLAFRLLLSPALWVDKRAVVRAAQLCAGMHGGRHVQLTSSGRQALFLALSAAGIGRGDEVITQAYTCIAVPEAIQWTGARPVYADIREDTLNLDVDDVVRKITKNTKGIIVQHTFGIPGPVVALRRVCDERGILLIEDCAHGLGASLDGKQLGTFGDISFFSFGRDKIVSSVFGGAIMTDVQHYRDAISHMQKTLSDPPAWWTIQQLLHPILMHIAKPLYCTFHIGKALIVAFQTVGLLSRAVDFPERTGDKPRHIGYSYSAALAQLLAKQLGTLATSSARRRAIAKQYNDAFSETGVLALLRYPILVNNQAAVRQRAKDACIILDDWFGSPLIPRDASLRAFHYTTGSCPVAERVATRIVTLPMHPGLSDEQVRHIITTIRSAIA